MGSNRKVTRTSASPRLARIDFGKHGEPIEKRPRYLRVEEVAHYFGFSKFTVYDWCRRGRIPCLKAPGRNGAVRIREDDVLALEGNLRREVTAAEVASAVLRR